MINHIANKVHKIFLQKWPERATFEEFIEYIEEYSYIGAYGQIRKVDDIGQEGVGRAGLSYIEYRLLYRSYKNFEDRMIDSYPDEDVERIFEALEEFYEFYEGEMLFHEITPKNKDKWKAFEDALFELNDDNFNYINEGVDRKMKISKGRLKQLIAEELADLEGSEREDEIILDDDPEGEELADLDELGDRSLVQPGGDDEKSKEYIIALLSDKDPSAAAAILRDVEEELDISHGMSEDDEYEDGEFEPDEFEDVDLLRGEGEYEDEEPILGKRDYFEIY